MWRRIEEIFARRGRRKAPPAEPSVPGAGGIVHEVLDPTFLRRHLEEVRSKDLPVHETRIE